MEENKMSERGSFVTEYMYCDKCLEKMKHILIQSDKYLYGRQIGDLPIIAGKLGSFAEPRIMTIFPNGTVEEYDEGEYERACADIWEGN